MVKLTLFGVEIDGSTSYSPSESNVNFNRGPFLVEFVDSSFFEKLEPLDFLVTGGV